MPISRNDIVTTNQKGWNIVAPKFYGGTALPKYGPLSVTEPELQLIGNLKDKSVLELGFGSGHTLHYLWKEKQASDLWGLDLSQEQIQYARDFLAKENIPAKLLLASMDENPGIPESYFDMVVSIYSLGWTPDLPRTLSLVHSYLKPGGKFVFSWEHPVYQCLEYDTHLEKYVMARSYLDETPELDPSWKGVEIVIQPRKLSTYINALCGAGLMIERMVESEIDMDLARPQDYAPEKWYSVPRANLMPTTFIVKAFKP